MYQLNKRKCWLAIGIGFLLMYSATGYAHSNHRIGIHIELGSYYHYYHKPPRVIHRHFIRHGHHWRQLPRHYRQGEHQYRVIHKGRH